MNIERPIVNQFEGNSWILPTSFKVIEQAGQAIEEKSKKANFDAESAADVRAGFEEALVNAFAHGNYAIPGGTKKIGIVIQEMEVTNPTNKKVYVNIDMDEDALYIQVRDEGKGFNYHDIPNPTLPENLLKESGRGIFHMKNIHFDKVEHIGNGNTVILTKYRKK